MLGQYDAIATIAITDLEAARKFYQDTLGLTPLPSEERSVLSFKSGNSSVLVYQSESAGTNQATCVTWAVPDVDAEIQALKAKGVGFEHYDFPGTRRDGDIHITGSIRVAWFKDPAGNIISVVNDNG